MFTKNKYNAKKVKKKCACFFSNGETREKTLPAERGSLLADAAVSTARTDDDHWKYGFLQITLR